MMDAEAIRQIQAGVVPSVETVNGRERLCLPENWEDATPKPAVPDPIGLTTLSGLVAYIQGNPDGLLLGKCLIVVRANSVVLAGALEGYDRDFARSTFVHASYHPDMAWGVFFSPEEFIVRLQSQFLQTPDREKLLAIVSTIREGSVRETIDDGLKQEVRTQRGVSLVNMTTVPNPVTLQPFRTFPEIEQPISQFVVRMRSTGDGKPTIALFEAEGGAWEVAAISRIRVYLQDALEADQRPEGEKGLVIIA